MASEQIRRVRASQQHRQTDTARHACVPRPCPKNRADGRGGLVFTIGALGSTQQVERCWRCDRPQLQGAGTTFGFQLLKPVFLAPSCISAFFSGSPQLRFLDSHHCFRRFLISSQMTRRRPRRRSTFLIPSSCSLVGCTKFKSRARFFFKTLVQAVGFRALLRVHLQVDLEPAGH